MNRSLLTTLMESGAPDWIRAIKTEGENTKRAEAFADLGGEKTRSMYGKPDKEFNPTPPAKSAKEVVGNLKNRIDKRRKTGKPTVAEKTPEQKAKRERAYNTVAKGTAHMGGTAAEIGDKVGRGVAAVAPAAAEVATSAAMLKLGHHIHSASSADVAKKSNDEAGGIISQGLKLFRPKKHDTNFEGES